MKTIPVFLLIVLVKTASTLTLLRENVVFEKVNTVTTTHAKWLVAIQINLNPYRDLMNRLNETLTEIEVKIINGLKLEADDIASDSIKNHVNNLLYIILKEVKNLQEARDYAKRELKEIETMHRSKRALLPIIGKAMNYLFGTLDESSVEAIKRNIRKLAERETILQHVVEENLSLLKTTQGQVIENRRTLNAVIEALVNVTSVTKLLEGHINDIQTQLEIYTYLDREMSEAKELMNIVREHAQLLKLQLNMLSLGHLSPSVISPGQLTDLLTDIKGQLEQRFKLPFEPEQDIWNFYKTLTCTTLIDRDHLIVVLAIPLLDTTGTYEIFKTHNIPLPRKNSNNTQLNAKFRLESTHIAVNQQHSKFTLLNDREVRKCSSSLKPYCNFHSPIYSEVSSDMCIIQLFMNNKEGIEKYCQIMMLSNKPSPQARYLTDGHWLISSPKPLSFSITCNAKTTSKMIVTKTPIDIIILQETCSAFNSYLTLLPYYTRKSNHRMTDTFKKFLEQYNKSTNVLWKNFDRAHPNSKINIPKRLKGIEEIPMDHFIHELDQADMDLEAMPTNSHYYYIPILATIVILLVIAFCFRQRLRKLYSKLNKSVSREKRNCIEMSNQRVEGDTRYGLYPSAPNWYDDNDTEDMTVKIDGRRTAVYGPDSRLTVNFWKEKYDELIQNCITSYASRENVNPGKNNEEIEMSNQRSTMTGETPKHDDSVRADITTPSSNLRHETPRRGNSVYPSLRREIDALREEIQ